jgi:hypothetical protein
MQPSDFDLNALIPAPTPDADYAKLYAAPPEVQDAQRLQADLLALSDVNQKAAFGFIVGGLLAWAKEPELAERTLDLLRAAKNFTTPAIASPDEAAVEPVPESAAARIISQRLRS